MIVVIDPELKKLFFDKVMDMCGNSPYESVKWIEAVAYGERVMIIGDELSGYIERNENLQKLKEQYKKALDDEKRRHRLLNSRMLNVNAEIDSYIDEIAEYRLIIHGAGLGGYLEDE